MPDGTCTDPGCDRPIAIKKWSLCRRHYQIERKAGRLSVKRHPVRRRHVVRDGTCAIDGPVTVVQRPDGRVLCRVSASVSKQVSRKGIPATAIDARMTEQDGRCATCLSTFDHENPPCLDHDHACCPGTRACARCFRGLLCRRCNAAAGMLLDNPAIAIALADYLRMWQSRES